MKVKFEALQVGQQFTFDRIRWEKISDFAAIPVARKWADSENFEGVTVNIKC